MKLADSVSYPGLLTCEVAELTVSGRVHDDKTGVDPGGLAAIAEVHSVGMAPKPFVGFVEMDFMGSSFERPQSGNTRDATAHNGDSLLALHSFCHYEKSRDTPERYKRPGSIEVYRIL